MLGLKNSNKRKGFALLELVISLGIIGIIASISIPNYLIIKDRTALSSDISSSKFIGTAIREVLKIDYEVNPLKYYLSKNEDIVIKIDNFDKTGSFDLSINSDPVNPGSTLHNLFIGVNNPSYRNHKGYKIRIPKNNMYDIDIKYSNGDNIELKKDPKDPV